MGTMESIDNGSILVDWPATTAISLEGKVTGNTDPQ